MGKILVLLICCIFFQGGSCGTSKARYNVADYKKYIVGTWASFTEGNREKPSSYFVTFNEDGTLIVVTDKPIGEKKIIKKSTYTFKSEKVIETPAFPRHLLIDPYNENEVGFVPEVSSGTTEVSVLIIYGSKFKRVK